MKILFTNKESLKIYNDLVVSNRIKTFNTIDETMNCLNNDKVLTEFLLLNEKENNKGNVLFVINYDHENKLVKITYKQHKE